ncbi:MAG: amino acid synthesis family protein [Hyphomicrobiaceae bacterium]
MTDISRIVVTRDVLVSEMGQKLAKPIVRAVGYAVIANPFAGRFAEDLGVLFQAGCDVGDLLAGELAGLLGGPAVAYGKAAIVGTSGEKEHGGAAIHPMLGKPMRAAIGGGKAVIPSNVKVGGMGCSIDVPIGHKDNVWSFDHFDTISVMVGDAPRADEIAVILVLADGGRAMPRCGDGPV